MVRLRVKPDFSALGPRFGEDTPDVAEAVEGLGGEAAGRLRDGQPVRVSWPGGEAEVGPDEVEILEEARGDLAVDGRGGYLAALDPSLDEDLRREGLARELVNRVQRLRRDAGLEVSDRIELSVAGDEPVERAAAEHRDYIAGETLALEDGRARLRVGGEEEPRGGGRGADAPHPTGRVPSLGEAEHSEDVEIEGHHARIALRRSGAPTG